MEAKQKLYIMISRTDTGIGKLIRRVSGYAYNHVSVTLDSTFRNWVSFARVYQNIPLHATYIREPVERFLAKGEQIDVRIFAVELKQAYMARIQKFFNQAGRLGDQLTYNYLELLTSAFGFRIAVSGAYTCLGFASKILGKEYLTIQQLDSDMTDHLVYEGTLNALTPDSGSRTDTYFARTNLLQCLCLSFKTMSTLVRKILSPEKGDPLDEICAPDLTEAI